MFRFAAGTKPVVSITIFVPDLLKDGGRYETVTEKIRRVDPHGQVVILDRKTGIAGSYESLRMADILEMQPEETWGDIFTSIVAFELRNRESNSNIKREKSVIPYRKVPGLP